MLRLTRIVFTFFLWVLVARWTYAEVELVFPSCIPTIDYALEHVKIPTHDKWSKEEFNKLFAQLSKNAKDVGL